MQHIPPPDAPALALDDILRPMSPSPAPQPLTPDPSCSTFLEHRFPHPANHPDNASIIHSAVLPPRATSPEPLDYLELESIRAHVQEYVLSPNTKEAELAAMVLRLISQCLLHPSPGQLASQAETIAELAFQRDLLLHEQADERERWRSERDSWRRMADILASKARAAYEPIYRDQASPSTAQDDLKTSRRRLADTQTRMSVLESELSRLRPLLSMQATLLRDPDLWRSQELSGLVAERIAAYARRWKGKERATHPSDSLTNVDASQNAALPNSSHPSFVPQIATPTIPDTTSHAQQADIPKPPSTTDAAPPPPPDLQHKSDRHHRHRKDRDKDRDKDRKYRHRYQPSKPILADARAECILAAARTIGRARAGVLSGLVKERAKLESEADALAAQNMQASNEYQDTHHVLLSPPTSQPRPSVAGATTSQTPYEGQAGSSSPPVPLAASYRGHANTASGGAPSTHRRLAPSPFPAHAPAPAPAPSLSFARTSHLPTHLHPSGHAYSASAQGRHPHAVPQPGYMYFAPGPGQSGPVPYVVPVAWGVPGTPTAPPTGSSRQRHADEYAQAESSSSTRTPARNRTNSTTESVSTPMDSLVNAARSLIEDEDYDDERDTAPTGAETDTVEEDAGADETPSGSKAKESRRAQ
ncbi:hypothetical protein ONZ51_g8059 [Trametes cubensis]|uniref:Uncharacterized protein n=1 Tax=Trametes cubensis TaxID=1111947 RepID=A0AAD7TPC0_9APHY|nr:hypothetical protein ONZ51_g8059 [Trametes cubensis]